MEENHRRKSALIIASVAAVIMFLLPACTAAERTSTEVPKPPILESPEREGQLLAVREQAEELFHDRFPGQPLPDASLIRAVAPSEWSETIARCMTDEGFESHVKGGAVETASYPVEQALAQATAVYRCRVGYPIDPIYLQPYTTEETTYLYRYLVDTVVPCLEDEGYSTPDIPSAGTFEDQLNAGQEWSPFDSLDPGSEEKYTSLTRTCPGKPAGFRGY